jgi:hypothetical protein
VSRQSTFGFELMIDKMLYHRLLKKEEKPSEKEIIKTIGNKASLWLEIHKYIKEKYDFTSELVFWTKKYGWAIRYKKSGKTISYFFPEKGAYSTLIVLGKKESEKIDLIKRKLNTKIRLIFENTEQLHDGRWLWIRVLTKSDVKSIKVLLSTKRKPKKENIT